MYIIISVAVLSFTGTLSLFFYRLWELKSGRIASTDSSNEHDDVSERLYNFFCVYNKLFVYYTAKSISLFKDKIVKIISKVLNWRSAILFKNLTNSRIDINEKNSGASLYLKDIAEHKNNIKPPTINHL